MRHALDACSAAKIEAAAENRFYEYFDRRREAPSVPLPLEPMLKSDLELRLAFLEIERLLGSVKLLGFLCIPHRTVMIDESLHPNEYPEMRSRYRFTVSHEIGHWCLHRHDPDVALGWARRDPAREAVREMEANRFAGALMMPKELLRSAWRESFASRTLCRSDLLPRRSQLIREEVGRRQFLPAYRNAMVDLMFEGAVSRLAEQFGVSPQAMRIRCQDLGLIVR